MPKEPETQNCRSCYNSNPLGAIYCSTCGEKLVPASAKASKAPPKKPPTEFIATDPNSKSKAPNNTRALSIAGGVTAFVVLVAGLVAYNETLMSSGPQSDSNLSYGSIKAEIEAIPVSAATCEAAAQLVENEPFYLLAREKINKSQKAAKRLTIWNADRYLAKNPWVRNSLFPDDEMPYGKFIRELSEPLFETTLASLNSSFLDDVEPEVAEISLENFSRHLIEACVLKDVIEENRKLVWALDSANAKIIVLAQQKPWYPKGFVEVAGYPGFAYKNSPRNCSYSFGGSCAIFDIVSRTGCPSNLYVQTNLLSGGTVVDWSNDTAIVRAGQIALMETTFTRGYGEKWEFAEISCY